MAVATAKPATRRRDQTDDGNAATALRAALTEYRRRGVDFDQAWVSAVGWALQRAPTNIQRRDWQAAFAATKPTWEAAYAREATEQSKRLSQLARRRGL